MNTDYRKTDRTADEIACETFDPNVACRCRDAVQRAYREMVATGSSHADAHMVAARVYRNHHPGSPVAKVNRLVAQLVEPSPLN